MHKLKYPPDLGRMGSITMRQVTQWSGTYIALSSEQLFKSRSGPTPLNNPYCDVNKNLSAFLKQLSNHVDSTVIFPTSTYATTKPLTNFTLPKDGSTIQKYFDVIVEEEKEEDEDDEDEEGEEEDEDECGNLGEEDEEEGESESDYTDAEDELPEINIPPPRERSGTLPTLTPFTQFQDFK